MQSLQDIDCSFDEIINNFNYYLKKIYNIYLGINSHIWTGDDC
jgi:hypothetical protein